MQLTFAASDDNGSTSASTWAVESGSVVQLSTGDYVATKDGWTHLWWNTDPSATEALDSITLTWDTTVYAIFSKNLTVNYDKWTWVSEISKTSDNCTVYNTGTSCTLTSPTITVSEWYENWVWTKWDDTLNPGEDVTLTSDGDTYTAIATAKEYAITFVDESGENWPEVHSWAYLSDISNITFPSWTRDRYIISWDKEIPATMPLNGDTITASWTQNPAPSWNGGWYSGWGGSRNSSDSKGTENNPSVTDVTAPLESGAQWDNDGSSLSRGDAASAERGWTQNYSDEFQKAYEFAYKNWITTMDSIEKANMGWKLTRIAMAKMLSYYAINVLWQKPDETRNNKFNDITEKLDTEYDNWVTLAYQLWIMWINMPNNEFRPNDLVTRAEFATALSRMLYSTPDGNPYYVPHIEKLKSEWILTNDDYKMKELRGYVMIMLMRSAK